MEGAEELLEVNAIAWRRKLEEAYKVCEEFYQYGLRIGVPKEVARMILPVGRYSRMRASGNLWNWLHFMSLRYHPRAQWEIRQFANALGGFLGQEFPHVWKLFESNKGE